MKEALLGIDIGTSSCKLATFSIDGTVIATASEKYAVYYPEKGWAEQKPEEWWDSVVSAIQKLLKMPEMQEFTIVGIGVDGQGWSMIPIDSDGKVLYNNPIWMDTRAKDICDEVKAAYGDRIFEVSGNPFEPTYSLPKLLWLKRHHPEIFKKIDQVLQANSYIVYKLTGAKTQDLSQGYGLQCFDMKKGEWNQEICELLGVPLEILPPIVKSDQVVGSITAEISQLTGLEIGIPVVAGGVDAACGTLGVGVIAHGETQEQGGQAEGMSICLNECIADKRLILGYHVVPNHWLLQGGTVGGGGVLDWVKNNYCLEEKQNAQFHETDAYYEMDRMAKSVPAGSDGVVFLPYMAGERSPIWNPHAKGVYYGFDFTKTRSHLIRASQEGVAYSLKDNLEVAESAGAIIGEMRAMGGSANSEFWTQMKADVTGKVIKVPSSDTATTLGAAILAGIGVGVYKDYQDARDQTIKVKKVYHPNPEVKKEYDQGFAQYKRLYQQLEPLMTE
ncbi:xylulokinase [Carnobacterium gallinarum]|uniref:xylulokinase n=1 Tax=Carnobacterium gallinarum TaxID=2749 RepID=UPI00054D4609|nr:FGGY-family carbohydrate kinase [Carnobacterium gallinarum]